MSVIGSNTNDEPRPGTVSPLHKSPVPRGSDAFQEALLQAYTDMKEKKKRDKTKTDDEEDYSDEERDKCMDINLFRRFALSEHASKLNPHFRGERSNHVIKAPVRGVTTEHITELDSRWKSMERQPPGGRRHSIATITPSVTAKKSPFH